MHSLLSRLLLCLSMALLGVLLTSCVSYRAGDPARAARTPTPVPADAWPAWSTAALEPVRDATPAIVPKYELIPGFPPEDRDERAQAVIDASGYRVVHNEIAGGGLLRVFEQLHPETKGAGVLQEIRDYLQTVHPNGSYLSGPDYELDAAIKRATDPIYTDEKLNLISFRVMGLQDAESGFDAHHLGGTLEIELPPVSPDARGILIHLPGLFSSEQERETVAVFRRAGWAIVDIEAEPSIDNPNAIERAITSAKRSRRAAELREQNTDYIAFMEGRSNSDRAVEAFKQALSNTNEQALEEFPFTPNGFWLTDDTDPARLGALIAAGVNKTMAEHAYAAESVVGYLDAHRPDLAGKPIVVVGFSAGGLAAPGVAARLRGAVGDRLGAMVVIGGGADMFAISRETSFNYGGIRLAPKDGPQPSDERVELVHRAYLEHAVLDPYYTAAALSDLPALVMHARKDRIIPAAAADLLAERLGGADRIVTTGGHGMLFYKLPSQARRITRWLDEQTR